MALRLRAVVAGRADNPLVAAPLLYFHSYRKVTPEPVEFGALADPGRTGAFKFEVLRTLLARVDLLEGAEPQQAEAIRQRLDSLVQAFAGGRVGKLQLQGNNLDVQVDMGLGTPPLPFDALSSGQKEIISTLFLIWEATRDCPSVVLIDEPELHLHQEWHDDVMRMLFELAPWNQYIIATHSRRIAESGYPDRLRLIKP